MANELVRSNDSAVLRGLPRLRVPWGMRRPASADRSGRGFSLIEIIVVLVLLGAAALLVAPSFTNGLKGFEMRAAARDLVTRMKMARTQAISTQSVHRMIMTADEQGQAYYALADEYEQIVNTYPLPEGVSIVTEDDEHELPLKVSFYPNGRSSGAAFVLMRGQGMRIAVTVDSVTGLGRVVRDEERQR